MDLEPRAALEENVCDEEIVDFVFLFVEDKAADGMLWRGENGLFGSFLG